MTKHLSLTDRALIEKYIALDFTFASIAKIISRSPATISREVRKRRRFTSDYLEGARECIYYASCIRIKLCKTEDSKDCINKCKFCTMYLCTANCSSFVSVNCPKLNKPPYVCTGCPEVKACRKNHAYYSSHIAHSDYLKELKNSRTGIRTEPERLVEINELISPLILKGQSINHIFANHSAQIGLSEKTIYNYIDNNAFDAKNLDLPRKVKYRLRHKKHVLTRMEYEYRRGRTIENYNEYMQAYPHMSVVEMDTVKSARGSLKTLLTFIFTESNFMLVFLMEDNTQASVEHVFEYLTEKLGTFTFQKVFPVILTDNGVEFKNPKALEHAPNGELRTKIFYCDPQASWQKPHVEKNHVLIRQILPKGTSFSKLTASDVHLITRHINSVSREKFDNRTPFDLMYKKEHKALLEALELTPVPADEVCLKPKLLNHN